MQQNRENTTVRTADFVEKSTIVKDLWKNLSPEERAPYETMHLEDRCVAV